MDSFEVQAKQWAPSYIGETAQALEGELEVIATGPLTNIARAITAAPAACARIKHLYIMGGAFWMNRAEHNIKCDADAALVVFGSGIAMTVISLDLTLRVRLGKNDLPRIAALGNGLGPLLKDQLIRWWEYAHIEGNSPHDPLAALAMVRPGLFGFGVTTSMARRSERSRVHDAGESREGKGSRRRGCVRANRGTGNCAEDYCMRGGRGAWGGAAIRCRDGKR